MAESDYWRRFWTRRLSRRRILRAAALGGAGLAAAAVVGCGEKEKEATPTALATPTAYRGGTLQLPGYEAFVSDTLDPHQTEFGPVYSSHSAVFSKVLRYEDIERGVIVPYLAQAMPEMPDPLTYIIRLRPGVRLHQPSAVLGRSPTAEEKAVGGRELTAEDVKYSFERQMNEASPRRVLFRRADQYQTIDSIKVVDPLTLEIRTKRPTAPFIHFLADSNAFIVAKELVDANDEMNRSAAMLGTGPFMWDKLRPLVESSFVRNPDWFGWGEPELKRPYVDGYKSFFLFDDVSVEAAFRTKKLDVAFQVNNPQWVLNLRADDPSLISVDMGFAAWVTVSFIVDQPPYNDIRLRRAIHLATDRQQMLDAFWQGYGKMQGPVGWVLPQWALPQEELLTKPGYRLSKEERQQDEQEARRLYEAVGSPDLKVIFANQPPYIPQFAPQYKRQLEQVLGAKVEYEKWTYPQISTGMDQGTAPFVFSYDNGWIDLDDWLYPYFHTNGSKNSFGLSDPTLDGMLEAQREEFDFAERQRLGYEIQRYLLDNTLARLDFVAAIWLWVAWPYYRNFRPTPFFGNSFLMANAWLDQSNAAWGGRP
ncbi:MAG: ABC transporter substrate-binding protein [Dehalococcoidia bacterium]|nr:ABC transporter substrate-binding protein [Dehalococcoidia bacterium]